MPWQNQRMAKNKKIVILGGGPAGIGAGWRLKELDYQNWELHEKENFLGGLSASFKDKKGFVWDNGGHIYFSKNDYFNKMFRKLMGKDFFKKERFQYIWWNNKLVPYPFQNHIRHLPPRDFIECLWGMYGNKKMKPKNFLEFNLAVFGSGITKHFMLPYNEKVWAHPLNKMSFDWVAERVSKIDFKKSLENIILERDERNWGPNFYFSYPREGGAGNFWARFLPRIKDNITLNSKLTKISFKNRTVSLKNDSAIKYDYCISTLPIDSLVYNSDAPKDIKKVAQNLVYNSGLILGFGIKGKQPEFLKDKIAFYFPQKDILFQRMVILKNFSPQTSPKNHWSLMFEASFSRQKLLKKDLVKNVIHFVKSQKWIKAKKDIISVYLREIKYFYPIPTIERDKNLRKIQKFLKKNNVFSIGRFGGWKYEIGNMDHSFMQGVEIINKMLSTR